MGLAGLARLKWRLANWGSAVLEHPLNSWLWMFVEALELLQLPGVFFTTVWLEEYGLPRSKGMGLMHNCEPLHFALNQPVFPNLPGLLSWGVHEEDDGSLTFDTKGAAEYPWEFCRAYSRVVQMVLGEWAAQSIPSNPCERPEWLLSKLLADVNNDVDVDKGQLFEAVSAVLVSAFPGNEASHLELLLRHVDHRGSDVRLDGVQVGISRSLVPYPAFIWNWSSKQVYPWMSVQHINVLEAIAFFNYLRSKSKNRCFHSLRFFHILDSTVAAAAIARGRSPSIRLNRPCRRISAYALAMDAYVLTLWTLSKWMYADGPSRVFDWDSSAPPYE